MSQEGADLFPSGRWTGFYNYGPGQRHRMDLQLTFANGALTGDGNDDVGGFLIKGRYNAPSLECHWTKTYIGAHDVFYRGFREGKGIWGTWEIGLLNHGGFHIWPLGAEAAQNEAVNSSELIEERQIEIPAYSNPKMSEIQSQAHLLPKLSSARADYDTRRLKEISRFPQRHL